jgi:hypothetical protein
MNFELLHRFVDRVDRIVCCDSIRFDLSGASLRGLPVPQVERFPDTFTLCGPINPDRTDTFL